MYRWSLSAFSAVVHQFLVFSFASGSTNTRPAGGSDPRSRSSKSTSTSAVGSNVSPDSGMTASHSSVCRRSPLVSSKNSWSLAITAGCSRLPSALPPTSPSHGVAGTTKRADRPSVTSGMTVVSSSPTSASTGTGGAAGVAALRASVGSGAVVGASPAGSTPGSEPSCPLVSGPARYDMAQRVVNTDGSSVPV